MTETLPAPFMFLPFQKQQASLKQAVEESSQKKHSAEAQQDRTQKQLSIKTQQESNIVEQLRVIVGEREAKVKQLENEISQLKLQVCFLKFMVTPRNFLCTPESTIMAVNNKAYQNLLYVNTKYSMLQDVYSSNSKRLDLL